MAIALLLTMFVFGCILYARFGTDQTKWSTDGRELLGCCGCLYSAVAFVFTVFSIAFSVDSPEPPGEFWFTTFHGVAARAMGGINISTTLLITIVLIRSDKLVPKQRDGSASGLQAAKSRLQVLLKETYGDSGYITMIDEQLLVNSVSPEALKAPLPAVIRFWRFTVGVMEDKLIVRVLLKTSEWVEQLPVHVDGIQFGDYIERIPSQVDGFMVAVTTQGIAVAHL